MGVARGLCLGALAITVAVPAGSGAAAANAATQAISPSFIARADRLCAAVNGQFNRALGPFPFRNFDPTRPDLATLPKVGRHFAKGESIRRAIPGRLRGLGEPAAGRRPWDAIRTLALQENAASIDQISAALASDATAFVATVNRIQTLQDTIHSKATAAGFPKSTACGLIF